MSFLSLATGGGGVSGHTPQTSTSGNNDVRAATGTKNINIGGNPNVQSLVQSPLALGALVLVAVLLWRTYRK